MTGYTAEIAAAALTSGEADQIAALQSTYYAENLDASVLSSLAGTEIKLSKSGL